jgi:hypothetical protein
VGSTTSEAISVVAEPITSSKPSAPHASMVRDEQAAEARQGREAVEHHPHDGAAGKPWPVTSAR